jgi:hypothetical protein
VRSAPTLLTLAALVLLAVAVLPRCSGAPRSAGVLASWTLTPGVLNAGVTQATIGSTICGLRGPPSAYQEDHLISLELGGDPEDPRNLWPEPYPRASDVDRIENQLNEEVCSGKLTLAEAQRRESALKHREG